jgi:truncated hemoglobin YjbI
LTDTFFDEMKENSEVGHFFDDIAMVALKYHCVKFFRVVLGPEEDKPNMADLSDWLLQSHARCFREMDMVDDHFDQVSVALEDALMQYQIEKKESDEVMKIWNSTRDIFVYGAKVAKREKNMTPAQLEALPAASYQTMGTETPVSLPAYSQIDVPVWVEEALSKAQLKTEVRTWTCELTERFGAEGDEKIAGTFMSMPYMAHHVYCTALLGLAFMPDNVDPKKKLELLEIVLYPRGRDHSPLSRSLFDRMIDQFSGTCDRMGLPHFYKQMAEAKLRTLRDAFGKKTVKVDGINAPHILCRGQKKIQPKQPKAEKPKKLSTSEDDSTDEGDASVSNTSLSQSNSRSQSQGSSGGWLNFFAGKKKVMHVVT